VRGLTAIATAVAASLIGCCVTRNAHAAEPPTDPDPAMGAVIFVYPNEHMYAGVGIFDGAGHEGLSTGPRGPGSLFGSTSGWFFIGEAGVKWTSASHLAGRVALGGWGHSGQYQRFDGGMDNGASGPYAVAEQQIWRKHPDADDDAQGVGAFFQYGYANPAISEVSHHVGGGVAWTGPCEYRKDDIIGAGLTYVRFTDSPAAGFAHNGELAVEAFYKIAITPWLSVKPDIQFIHNPSGAAGVNDSVAGSVQFKASF